MTVSRTNAATSIFFFISTLGSPFHCGVFINPKQPHTEYECVNQDRKSVRMVELRPGIRIGFNDRKNNDSHYIQKVNNQYSRRDKKKFGSDIARKSNDKNTEQCKQRNPVTTVTNKQTRSSLYADHPVSCKFRSVSQLTQNQLADTDRISNDRLIHPLKRVNPPFIYGQPADVKY